MCGNRWVLFDNKTEDELKKKEQLQQLLLVVSTVIAKNDGKPYTVFTGLKKGDMELYDETKKVNSLEEVSQLKDQRQRSYEEQMLKRITEMVEMKMKRLEQKLAEEKVQMKSNDEMNELREQLKRAQWETEELRKQSGSCAIL